MKLPAPPMVAEILSQSERLERTAGSPNGKYVKTDLHWRGAHKIYQKNKIIRVSGG